MPPLVIAHRGCSGRRPEHTLESYRLAIAEGCDFIEPDLVPTRDGVLVARHENEIGETTDVAARPEFAARRTIKVIDGRETPGWFVEDFTLAEVKTLRARERLPALRPANTAYDGRFEIPTFAEVIALTQAEGARLGRRIGVYPELKHPTVFVRQGFDVVGMLLRDLERAGWAGAGSPVFLQCFEVETLRALAARSPLPKVQLISGEGAPYDAVAAGAPLTYAQMLTPAGLREVAGYAQAIGPEARLVRPFGDAEALGAPTALVRDAHAAGLLVHPWTVRPENLFLPPSLQRGDPADPRFRAVHGDVAAWLRALYAAGVDGVFSDVTAEAVGARAAAG